MSEPLVVVGKGMAATRLIDALSRQALGRYAIMVVGDEPRRAYNRVLLSSLLAGEIDEPDLQLKPEDWWRDRGVTQLFGRGVSAIDRREKRITLVDGTRLPYSRLVLATGSTPIRLPIPGADKTGVITFRSIEDVALMQAAAKAGKRAVVIGGGLLGLEAAHGLARGGARVTVVHLMDRLMERQLDPEAATLLAKAMRARNIDVLLEAATAEIAGGGGVTSVRLMDGREIGADLVVLAAGIRPNVELARAAGLPVNRGVLVDDGLASGDPEIFALGECAEHDGTVYGLVEPAYEQAEVLAARLAGRPAAYRGSTVATNLKVSGVHVFSAGAFLGGEGMSNIFLRDRIGGSYRKLVLDGDRLAGAVFYGDVRDAPWYLDLIRSGRSIASIRPGLIFGRAVAEPTPARLAA